MRISTLHVFLSVVNSGSFAMAAQLEHMTQPAISSAISGLEKEVGHMLILRSTGQRTPVTLTSAGERFADYARHALKDYREMMASLQSLDGDPSTLTILSSPTPASTIIPPLIRRFSQENPQIHLRTVITRSLDIYSSLLDGSVSLCLSATPPQHPDLIGIKFFYDPLVLIVPKSYNLRPSISRAELQELPLIIRPLHSSNLMRTLYSAMDKAGIHKDSLNIVQEVSANADVMQAVSLGSGAGFITNSLYEANHTNASFTKVNVKGLHPDRYLYITRNKTRPFPLEQRLFWDCVITTDWHTSIADAQTGESIP